MILIHYGPDWAEKLKHWRDYKDILADIEALGKRISEWEATPQPRLFLGVMNGVSQFMAHLLPHVSLPLEIDFVRVSSYAQGTNAGELELLYEPRTALKGRDVVLLDDIYDTGNTLAFLKDYCLAQGAKSVRTVVFVERKVSSKPPQYKVPIADRAILCEREEFLLGFGFDYKEHFRNLKHIYLFDPSDGIPSLDFGLQ